jgi:diguanylate cyclase (GGDEF)-like protein/PAS domain S-box-containing protein
MSHFVHLSRIALGLVALSCSILIFLDLVGFIPNAGDRIADERVRLAEAMVTQATLAATRNDMAGLRAVLDVAARRDEDLLSIGLSDARGALLMATRDHRRLWMGAEPERSSSTHLRMPIFNDGARWAELQIRFASPPASGFWLSLWRHPALRLVVAMAVLGFFANLVFLKRILRHLDPSAVVPARVQTALDVMPDGVLLLDAKERIVLANEAFCEHMGQSRAALLGLFASSLDWQIDDTPAAAAELPWVAAIDDGGSRTDVRLTIQPADDAEPAVFQVSASPVLDGWKSSKGAIATFKDVSELERNRRDLERALQQLEKSRDEIRLQNEELEVLARSDSLTGLANRRMFMEWYEEQFSLAKTQGSDLCCLMLDIDHFKRVNDEHGHAVGDEVIRRVAEALRSHTRGDDIACRYGGEEFCVALRELDVEAAVRLAERLRAVIGAPGFARVPVTVSLGVSSIAFRASSADELLDQADQALYASKRFGRNRVTRFDEIPPE